MGSRGSAVARHTALLTFFTSATSASTHNASSGLDWGKPILKEAKYCTVNGANLRAFRLQMGLTQVELAKLAGYSERLVRKAEMCGTLNAETVRDLATALTIHGERVSLADLTFDLVATAKRIIRSYDCCSVTMLDCCAELFAPEFVLHCPSIRNSPKMQTDWRGIDGLQAFLSIFFQRFTRVPDSLSVRYTIGENRVTARFDERLCCCGQTLEPLFVNLHFTFANCLVMRIDNEYDTLSMYRALRRAQALVRVRNSLGGTRMA